MVPGTARIGRVPHLLEKIEEVDSGIIRARRHRDDDPPSGSDEDSADDYDDGYPHVPKTLLQQREVSALSTAAWEEPDHPVPEVRRTWRSPDLLTFHSRRAAMDHAKLLVKRDKLIDKVLYGFGGHGLMCRPVKATRKAALEAGLFRFLRDGLWVVGQEEEWLEDALEVWKVREANREKREEQEEEEVEAAAAAAEEDEEEISSRAAAATETASCAAASADASATSATMTNAGQHICM